jgi:hypothetical protein
VLGSPAFEEILQAATSLGEIASLSIGAVTGCNPVFLLTDADREKYAIPEEDLQLVVTRARQLSTLTIDGAALRALDRDRDRIWLLAPNSIVERQSGARRRLAEISRKRRKETLWFSKRSPWWRVDAGSAPDAIFTYMNDTGPRLALVQGDLRCTNTLHSVRFKSSINDLQKKASALSMISTFGQLAAERIGRVYGGGLLKFELMDARRLPILTRGTDLDAAFGRATQAMQDGDPNRAGTIADEALLKPVSGDLWRKQVEEMGAELAQLRSVRRGGKG